MVLNWNNPKFTKQTVLKESPALITIDHVTIFDGTGVDAYENGRILIKDGQFIAVGKKETVEIPAESYIIDGTDMTALPGLIDAHIHLSFNGVFETYPIFFGEAFPERLSRNAWLTLKSGVTTAREMPGFGQVKLKESIDKGEVLGPRLLVSTSPLTVKGGYFDYPLFGTAIKDVGEVPKIIEKKVENGCNFIKTVAPYSDPLKKQKNMPLTVLSKIVKEANKLGLTVATHSMWLDGLETVIDAGVTSIEHCPTYLGGIIPEEVLIKAKDKGIFFVPTADLVRRNYLIFTDIERILVENEYEQNMPPKSLAKMLKMVEKIKKMMQKNPQIKEAYDNLFRSYKSEYISNFQKAIEFGVKIAAGTDSGTNYTPHGILPKELELYVEFGMTAKQAILSATKVAAQLLGLEKEIGTLESGKEADLILVKGNPLKKITDLQNIHLVIKGGTVVKPNCNNSGFSI